MGLHTFDLHASLAALTLLQPALAGIVVSHFVLGKVRRTNALPAPVRAGGTLLDAVNGVFFKRAENKLLRALTAFNLNLRQVGLHKRN